MARIRLAAGVLGGAAVLRLLAGPGLVNYDTLYALVWGRQLAHGELPDLEVAIAPTPHPLANLAATLLSPLSSHETGGLHGELAAVAAVGLAYVSLALLGWLVFALGREWFNAAAGVLAALIVLTRVPVLDFGARAYVDIPFLVLVLGALLVETRRPRAGAPVLLPLAVAGLLRPEAWLFSGAYLLWLLWPGLRAAARRAGPRRAAAWRDAAPLVLLAASAPLLWALHDLLLTGNPLHSLTGTRDNAALLGRVTGIEHVPAAVPRRLGEILREPVLLAAAGGGLLALAWRRDRRVRLGAWAGALALGAFCVLAAAGLPIITRYLLLSATLLAIFAGAGVFGWLELPPGRERTWWARFAAVALVALLVFVPSQIGRIDRLGDALARQEAIQRSLGELVAEQRLQRPVAVPNRRPIPLLALWLELDPGELVDAQEDGLSQRGSYLVPADGQVARDYILDRRDRDRRIAPPPPRYRLRKTNREWRLYERSVAIAARRDHDTAR
ncbi:MAG: hypothetical protein AVDCRST_MAG67-3574 [uncultured Solirubrobacteraceae bacterium]|uniref:Glycosyltransferase RgtA/B/C/D-like domain-containing protein n=1 Tax=uncultured Solirubrobacteraceae bacterium TaxID=1162706 RepID=A0A6J4TJR3_9ACTN|nr:MAG: hypothetical protein AVDCRST_MAG67-3574 [uncultured Solirubrobacteraceae bacterium]